MFNQIQTWFFFFFLFFFCFMECCSCIVALLCLTLRPHGLQQARLPYPSPSPGVFWTRPLLSIKKLLLLVMFISHWWSMFRFIHSLIHYYCKKCSNSIILHSLKAGKIQERNFPTLTTELFWCKNFIGTVVVQSLSCVWLFVTPWTLALQASLSFTISISRSLFKLMSVELVMPSTHLILWAGSLTQPRLLHELRSFPFLNIL